MSESIDWMNEEQGSMSESIDRMKEKQGPRCELVFKIQAYIFWSKIDGKGVTKVLETT